MELGLVSKDSLIDLLDYLPLVLHGLLWDFPNKQATKGGSFLVLLSFLGIISLLDSMRRNLKEHWFILWCQTRISLSSHLKRSSVAMSSLVRSAPTASLYISSKLVGIWDGLSVGVRRSSTASRLLSLPKIRIF